MGKLTANKVKNLVEAGTYEGGGGLRLLVKPSGRKTWVLRFQLNGKRREMGLGSYPQLDLKKARAAAYEIKSRYLMALIHSRNDRLNKLLSGKPHAGNLHS